MGNMIFNRRLSEDVSPDSDDDGEGERRIFPSHMYNGPLKLGDPNYRGLSKMEADPLIPQRMRDIIRTLHCRDIVAEFEECGRTYGGFVGLFKCRSEAKAITACYDKHFKDPELRETVTEEYLNERSHFRQTGIKSRRYILGKFQKRDCEKDPPFDENGKYIPQKPTGWDESYKKSGVPNWASYNYKME